MPNENGKLGIQRVKGKAREESPEVFNEKCKVEVEDHKHEI